MSYTKTNWINGQAPAISADNLNKIENKLEDLDTNKLNASALNDLIDTLFPVGKIEIFYDNEDHSNYLGFTWQRIASGRTLVGIDTTQTEFNTIGKTGGSKYFQRHFHDSIILSGTPIVAWNSQSGSTDNYAIENTFKTTGTANQNYFKTSEAGTGDSGNLQPYIVVSFWRRTQ